MIQRLALVLVIGASGCRFDADSKVSAPAEIAEAELAPASTESPHFGIIRESLEDGVVIVHASGKDEEDQLSLALVGGDSRPAILFLDLDFTIVDGHFAGFDSNGSGLKFKTDANGAFVQDETGDYATEGNINIRREAIATVQSFFKRYPNGVLSIVTGNSAENAKAIGKSLQQIAGPVAAARPLIVAANAPNPTKKVAAMQMVESIARQNAMQMDSHFSMDDAILHSSGPMVAGLGVGQVRTARFFADDSLENVEAARQIGVKSAVINRASGAGFEALQNELATPENVMRAPAPRQAAAPYANQFTPGVQQGIHNFPFPAPRPKEGPLRRIRSSIVQAATAVSAFVRGQQRNANPPRRK